jgi:hypothetical protein
VENASSRTSTSYATSEQKPGKLKTEANANREKNMISDERAHARLLKAAARRGLWRG